MKFPFSKKTTQSTKTVPSNAIVYDVNEGEFLPLRVEDPRHLVGAGVELLSAGLSFLDEDSEATVLHAVVAIAENCRAQVAQYTDLINIEDEMKETDFG